MCQGLWNEVQWGISQDDAGWTNAGAYRSNGVLCIKVKVGVALHKPGEDCLSCHFIYDHIRT